ncbi:hypothetical protein [Microbulbifer thermotolerans]|uniref:Uncharacterized protein n=1 Tax=Microbulbifer thermotolerans TaxID=252514 RepID=A0A143HRU0_MICTH|nr:hypothetical protein [Microbulbifer thermotolerans]AMX03992.1 hypothetical protein A3224_01485 [Microbulbifer thermotolerans]MCX2778263.1 hypothetical protein [Microbulbifer thermotolerans]MCX2782014.1 hypothetical protein [Microbulbifer thermotolerans]MCX2783228.1 hypothetical protein [Microbulbifer thermotolerans]MCX2804302.1 hypothetical protein [Microbulbifer thermotolerans]
MDEQQYLCEHYRFNAEQRLKGFNFFVILSMFAEGGIFTAVEKSFHPLSLALLGGFVVILSVVFWLVDARSRELLNLAVPALKRLEQELPETSRIFSRDSVKKGVFIRYTFAIRALLIGQFLFGAGVACYGLYHWKFG